MKLTPNFTLEEMIASTTAKQKSIYNTPTQPQIENLSLLCRNILQPVREAFGEPIIVSSGYRSYALNKAVGGASNSDHLSGAAADIHTKSNTKTDNKRLFDLIVKMANEGKIVCRQIIDEYGYKWIHVSHNHKNNSYKKNQILHIK